MKDVIKIGFLLLCTLLMWACTEEREDDTDPGPLGGSSEFETLLTNQVDGVIIPTMEEYRSRMNGLADLANTFSGDINQANLDALIVAYQDAYLAYQAAAVHNYFATANQALVPTSNLYPVDVDLLDGFIESRSYNFNTTAQQRANGFPALDFMFFSNDNTLDYFSSNINRVDFLVELVNSLEDKADVLVEEWTGSLRENFIDNGGTALGSSVSVQLNDHIGYYEEHIRENKIGIPIGLLGPNDDPIAADGTKIEGYYQSLTEGNSAFALELLQAAVDEMEDLYLGGNGQGYDDMLIALSDSSIDTDIKAQFGLIDIAIASRSDISGDRNLYDAVQGLVSLYKSDLFPVLNVQDADGANDGD